MWLCGEIRTTGWKKKLVLATNFGGRGGRRQGRMLKRELAKVQVGGVCGGKTEDREGVLTRRRNASGCGRADCDSQHFYYHERGKVCYSVYLYASEDVKPRNDALLHKLAIHARGYGKPWVAERGLEQRATGHLRCPMAAKAGGSH